MVPPEALNVKKTLLMYKHKNNTRYAHVDVICTKRVVIEKSKKEILFTAIASQQN